MCSAEGRRYYATVVEWFHGYARHSVLSRCMVTDSSKARFSIGPSQCYIKKATDSRVSLSLSLRSQSVFGFRVLVLVYAGWSSESVSGIGVSQSVYASA
jgi:hypothetical protein